MQGEASKHLNLLVGHVNNFFNHSVSIATETNKY